MKPPARATSPGRARPSRHARGVPPARRAGASSPSRAAYPNTELRHKVPTTIVVGAHPRAVAALLTWLRCFAEVSPGYLQGKDRAEGFRRGAGQIDLALCA